MNIGNPQLGQAASPGPGKVMTVWQSRQGLSKNYVRSWRASYYALVEIRSDRPLTDRHNSTRLSAEQVVSLNPENRRPTTREATVAAAYRGRPACMRKRCVGVPPLARRRLCRRMRQHVPLLLENGQSVSTGSPVSPSSTPPSTGTVDGQPRISVQSFNDTHRRPCQPRLKVNPAFHRLPTSALVS